MSDNTVDVSLLARADVPAAARTMIRAFADDPAWALVLDDAETRERVFRGMWPAVARYTVRWGVTRGVDKAAGVACWLRPGKTKVTGIRALLSGMWRTVTPLDKPKREEMMDLMMRLDEMHEIVMPEPHWYLWALATDPERQGEGIGTRLLEDGFEMAAASGHPICLESITAPNTEYYERRGFELRESGTVEPSGFPYWYMVWRP